jgi:hypothetical protein
MSSRSIRLRLPRDKAIQTCIAAGIGIYSSEALPLGITRIYCKTEQGAGELRQRCRDVFVAESVC